MNHHWGQKNVVFPGVFTETSKIDLGAKKRRWSILEVLKDMTVEENLPGRHWRTTQGLKERALKGSNFCFTPHCTVEIHWEESDKTWFLNPCHLLTSWVRGLEPFSYRWHLTFFIYKWRSYLLCRVVLRIKRDSEIITYKVWHTGRVCVQKCQVTFQGLIWRTSLINLGNLTASSC